MDRLTTDMHRCPAFALEGLCGAALTLTVLVVYLLV